MVKISEIRTNKVINEDGEILESTESIVFKYGKEPNFVKVYLDNIMFIAEIQGWISKVLYELIKSVSYANDGQLIIVNAGFKRIIAETLDMKTQSVTNAINTLAKKGILIKKDRGVFQLNPFYFGKGDWKDISKIRYEVELTGEGKTIMLTETEQTTEESEEPKVTTKKANQNSKPKSTDQAEQMDIFETLKTSENNSEVLQQ